MSEPSLEGGCLRYCATSLIDAGYYHCRLCQRSSGAPVLAWATFESTGFAYSDGFDAPARYASSKTCVREFCGGCGTQLVFRTEEAPDRIDLNIATLEDPSATAPEYHIWTASRICWFDTADDLPRHEDEGPDRSPA